MTMATAAMAEQRVAVLAPDFDRGVKVTQEVLVSDLRLAAFIGVHAHELGRRQSLVVHVRLGIETVGADHLEQTIDYNHVVEAAQALADQRIALIETFGQRLAAACLAFPAVQRAEVLVEKPGALNHAMAAARTVLERG
jgi:dihydroneopterin aldolase